MLPNIPFRVSGRYLGAALWRKTLASDGQLGKRSSDGGSPGKTTLAASAAEPIGIAGRNFNFPARERDEEGSSTSGNALVLPRKLGDKKAGRKSPARWV